MDIIEIERKWILPSLPKAVADQTPLQYERHFLFISDSIEIRIQRKGEKYEFERKVKQRSLERTGQKFEISKEEFNVLKGASIRSIRRESYVLGNISIKKYTGTFEGLIRAEVEFKSEEEAKAFEVPDWLGAEISDSRLGKDKNLVMLSEEDFKRELTKYKT